MLLLFEFFSPFFLLFFASRPIHCLSCLASTQVSQPSAFTVATHRHRRRSLAAKLASVAPLHRCRSCSSSAAAAPPPPRPPRPPGSRITIDCRLTLTQRTHAAHTNQPLGQPNHPPAHLEIPFFASPHSFFLFVFYTFLHIVQWNQLPQKDYTSKALSS